MRLRFSLLILCLAAVIQAQTDTPELALAKANVERIRALVKTGAVAPVQLQNAEEALLDVEDSATLRGTLYGSADLTPEQSAGMLEAAGRRVERKQQAFEKAGKLIQLGVASKTSVDAAREDLQSALKEQELAEGRASLIRQIAAMAALEEELEAKLARSPSEAAAIAERFDGDGTFGPGVIERVEAAFQRHFGKAMPVSARGETAVHRAMGFDHRGRVDVALQPDGAEGAWLRQYLIEQRIPFFAFRQAVPGKATGAHIHIGPSSTRLAMGG
jgi:hypothetical protein